MTVCQGRLNDLYASAQLPLPFASASPDGPRSVARTTLPPARNRQFQTILGARLPRTAQDRLGGFGNIAEIGGWQERLREEVLDPRRLTMRERQLPSTQVDITQADRLLSSMTIDERIEALAVNTESLHASVHELYGVVQQNSLAIRENSLAIQQNSAHIRALARIAEIHERRLSDREGAGDGPPPQ